MSNRDPNVRWSILVGIFKGEVGNQTNAFRDPFRSKEPNSQRFPKFKLVSLNTVSHEMLQSKIDYPDFFLWSRFLYEHLRAMVETTLS